MVDLPIYSYPGVDISVSTSGGNAASQLRQEYEGQKALYQSQPPLVQRFLEVQAHSICDALLNQLPRLRFNLPDHITSVEPYQDIAVDLPVPNDKRQQQVSGRSNFLIQINLEIALRQRLLELDQSSDQVVSLGARLIRHATAIYMVHTLLPAGHTVNYVVAEGEDIPNIPVTDESRAQPVITATPDSIGITGNAPHDGRGELIVPYVPAARQFYMPQWVAFDEHGRLLAQSVSEAEAHITSMQRFMKVLQTAVALAPYIVADDVFQQKRFGMLGQIVNQGRLLATYRTNEMIRRIKSRIESHQLNRGLSLSLPYFDDQDLSIHMLELKIIPFGRILFVPAFVVLAVRAEETRVAQDMRLSSSTRRHLMNELQTLEAAFITSADH